MASRRGFLGMMAATPLAARAAAESALGEMAKVSVIGAGNGMSNAVNAGYVSGIGTQSLPKLPDFPSLFANPLFREQYESLLFEECRSVTSIDPDIACMRSFSFNAKIAYQRQRNVERRVCDLKGKSAWNRIHEFMNNWMSK